MKNKGNINTKDAEKNHLKGKPSGFGKTKRKWIPDHKFFAGSKQEGQGFAFKRRQKAQHEYNKLLRKNKLTAQGRVQFEEEYPEHLKHLYLAEAETLRREEEIKRQNRSKRQQLDVSVENYSEAGSCEALCLPVASSGLEDKATTSTPAEPSSNLENGKKNKRKTSYQKTKEEYEKVCEKRAKKKEAYLKNKQQKEEALRIYKEKKLQTYQILSKKTKKGQPNLNLQMEFLLQKIQDNSK